MPILKKWATMTDASPYRAPECPPVLCLKGEIYEDDRFEAGKQIVTSPVVKAIGRLVETQSGTVYSLEGEPDQEWVEFLAGIGYDLDIENPIKDVEYEDSHYYRVFVKGGDA